MKCPVCHDEESRVVDSRTAGDSIRRRRQCVGCDARYTTHERIEYRVPWVVKKDGRREPFSRDKVLHGIVLACRKRPVDMSAMEAAVKDVEAKLELLREAEVPSSVVGAAVMNVLQEVDQVAHVRFASVYREFESVDQFIEAIKPLQETS